MMFHAKRVVKRKNNIKDAITSEHARELCYENSCFGFIRLTMKSSVVCEDNTTYLFGDGGMVDAKDIANLDILLI